MKCYQCGELGLESIVIPDGNAHRTLMGSEDYYDENGHFHSHDPNYSRAPFRCSRGHSWSLTEYGQCWCGWEGGNEI